MKNKITLANSDAYNAANLSEPLSAYCAGLPIDGGTAELLAFIAPEVKTAKRFEYTKFGDGIMLVDEDDERAVRGEFKEIDISGDVVNAKLVNHGLTLAIDDDEFFADYEQEAVRILKNRLVANELSRAVAMAKAAAGTLESKTWKSGGGTNPDLDIRKLITSVGDKGGINANRVLVGDAAWTYRLESLLGSQNTAAGGQAMFTIDNLRGFVGAEKSSPATSVSKRKSRIPTARPPRNTRRSLQTTFWRSTPATASASSTPPRSNASSAKRASRSTSRKRPNAQSSRSSTTRCSLKRAWARARGFRSRTRNFRHRRARVFPAPRPSFPF